MTIVGALCVENWLSKEVQSLKSLMASLDFIFN